MEQCDNEKKDINYIKKDPTLIMKFLLKYNHNPKPLLTRLHPNYKTIKPTPQKQL